MKIFKCDRDTEGRRKMEKFVGKKVKDFITDNKQIEFVWVKPHLYFSV